jgi:ABC-2 type transport system permease protein
MKSFGKLVKNELIKIFAQTAYKVLLFVMMGLFLLIPLINLGLTELVESELFWTPEGIDDQIEDYEYMAKNNDNIVDKQYYQTKAAILMFDKDNGMAVDSWQYNTTFASYDEYSLIESVYSLLANEEITIEEAKSSRFNSYLMDEVSDTSYTLIFEYAREERLELEQVILSSDISDFYQKTYDTYSEYKSSCVAQLGALKAEGLFDKTAKYEASILEAEIKATDNTLNILKHMIKIKAEYLGWEYYSLSAANTMISEIDLIEPPVTENEFNSSSFYYDEYDSYNSYIALWEEELQLKLDVAMVLEYSVLNDIPTQSVQLSSSKSVFTTTITSNLQYVMYFAIVLAAIIVAKEFSSGTARLLFIRPHSRSKILLSKYVTVMILVAVLNIINVILSFLFTIIFNGFGDIFASNLVVNNGVVEETSAILSVILAVFLANFRVVLFVSLAFMMSALCKKSALGIVVGLVSDLLFSTIYEVVALMSGMSALKYTPIAYYQMEGFAGSEIESVISQSFTMNILSSTNSILQSATQDLNIWIGIGYFVLFMGVCIFATFYPFRKQEIKN